SMLGRKTRLWSRDVGCDQTREANVRVRELLERVGLDHRIDAKPHQLSGGEQQRVALARALVTQPSILLMDEPLSSLDDERKSAIASNLLGLQNQFGFTLMYVTHDRSEADMLASKVCQMRNGQVEYSGNDCVPKRGCQDTRG